MNELMGQNARFEGNQEFFWKFGVFYKVSHEIKENFAKNNGQIAQCHFTICKPYVEQKGSHNSQMPCQDRLLFSLKYKKLEMLPSRYI